MTAAARAAAVVLAAASVAACTPAERADPPPATPTVALAVDVVADGDSFQATDGTRYRLQGINAPDLGECLADDAAARLRQLLATEVTVEEEGTDHFGRTLVHVVAADGTTVNERLVGEGMALAIHTDPPGRHQERLFDAQDAARSEQVGVWSAEACGGGPLPEVSITQVRSDPAGPDHEVLEGEFVVVTNDGDVAVEVGGWTLRDESTQNRFTFPAGTVVDPSETVTVTSDFGELGFGTGNPIWNNGGDTAYLLDERGRIVDWSPAGAPSDER